MMKRAIVLALVAASFGLLRADTLAENVAAVDSARAAISNAITAKGVSAPFALTQMSNAVMQIQQGGGRQPTYPPRFEPPSDWPNLRQILADDTSTYTNKIAAYYGAGTNAIRVIDIRPNGCAPVAYRTAKGTFAPVGSNYLVDISDGGWVVLYYDGAYLGESWMGYNRDVDTNKRLLWVIGENMSPVYGQGSQPSVVCWEGVDCLHKSSSALYVYANNGPSYSGVNRYYQSRQVFISDMAPISDNSAKNLFCRADSLVEGPREIDVSGVNIFTSFFENTASLRNLPRVIDARNATTGSPLFYGCNSITNVPTFLWHSGSYSCTFDFSSSYLIEPDSIAVFENGEIVGGMTYNLNDLTASATPPTVAFNTIVKGRFTDAQWTAIKQAFANKGWGISPQ